jgi:FtsH-binding integral membrane protein
MCLFAVGIKTFQRKVAAEDLRSSRRIALVGGLLALLLFLTPFAALLASYHYYSVAPDGPVREFIAVGMRFWTVLSAIAVALLFVLALWPRRRSVGRQAPGHSRGEHTTPTE